MSTSHQESKALRAAALGVVVVFACTGLASCGIAAWSKQAEAAKRQPPVTGKDRIAEGRHYFEMSCAGCHSGDASGDEGPDLRKLPISNAHIALVVRSGIPGEMPSFAKIYTQPQTDSVIAYLRSLK